ncbi:uncharacterized [Tachysurus ichikawai]
MLLLITASQEWQHSPPSSTVPSLPTGFRGCGAVGAGDELAQLQASHQEVACGPLALKMRASLALPVTCLRLPVDAPSGYVCATGEEYSMFETRVGYC